MTTFPVTTRPYSGRHAVLCYLPGVHSAVGMALLQNLVACPTWMPLYLLSDVQGETAFTSNVPNIYGIKIPWLGVMQNSEHSRASDLYAFWAFMETIQFAINRGLSEFLLIEHDCRFSVPHWDKVMFNEWKSHFAPAPFAGTPCCWHPWAHSRPFTTSIIKYAYQYQEASGVPMAFEGNHNGQLGTCLFPNGALAFYTVSELQKCFAEPLAGLRTLNFDERREMAVRYRGFDAYLGKWLVQTYGLDALKMVQPLTVSYSGCGNHHITLAERMAMFKLGTKCAIHHLKLEEFAA